MLKPINAAAGSTMASPNVRSVLVRSVNRHFLRISQPRQILHSPLHWHDYKDLSGRVVKPSQRIVKSCKKRTLQHSRFATAFPPGTRGGGLRSLHYPPRTPPSISPRLPECSLSFPHSILPS